MERNPDLERAYAALLEYGPKCETCGKPATHKAPGLWGDNVCGRESCLLAYNGFKLELLPFGDVLQAALEADVKPGDVKPKAPKYVIRFTDGVYNRGLGFEADLSEATRYDTHEEATKIARELTGDSGYEVVEVPK